MPKHCAAGSERPLLAGSLRVLVEKRAFGVLTPCSSPINDLYIPLPQSSHGLHPRDHSGAGGMPFAEDAVFPVAFDHPDWQNGFEYDPEGSVRASSSDPSGMGRSAGRHPFAVPFRRPGGIGPQCISLNCRPSGITYRFVIGAQTQNQQSGRRLDLFGPAGRYPVRRRRGYARRFCSAP